mmetsp:Transcript_21518/g.32023  ORF Transcript_21518/g.32023 Transcript_21518/m.32023 type:complete len:125 (+) Transcript_21518:180-554(+)
MDARKGVGFRHNFTRSLRCAFGHENYSSCQDYPQEVESRLAQAPARDFDITVAQPPLHHKTLRCFRVQKSYLYGDGACRWRGALRSYHTEQKISTTRCFEGLPPGSRSNQIFSQPRHRSSRHKA